ncbi:hypothetical protein, partial [Flexistipes sinusarabici]|uniref:hypothetical protein n=1 Tax=Flexistipes sinusarabici TaxID=2352 RepID=UPI0026EBC613
ESPQNFEKSFPKSELILNGVVIFKYKYVTRKVSDNVTNFSFDNNSLIFIKNDLLIIGEKYCGSIELHNDVSDLKLSSDFIMTTKGSDINIYSIKNCGKIFSLKRKYRGVTFSYPYIIQYGGKKFVINKIGFQEPFLSGGLKSRIRRMHYSDGFVYFHDEKDRIIPLLLITTTSEKGSGQFLEPLHLEGRINSSLFYKNSLFVNSEADFKKYSLSSGKIALEKKLSLDKASSVDKKDCRLVPENGVLCGKKVYLFSRGRFISAGNAEKVVMDGDNLISLNNRLLNITYMDIKRYIKEISLYRPYMRLCRRGSFYFFRDIDSKIRKINSVSYSAEIAGSIPDNCSGSYRFDNGSFYSESGKKVMSVASKVAESKTHTMFLRKIGKDYYYFFRKK